MADFKTHITFSTVMGVGYGAAGWWFYQVPEPTCILAAGLCGVSGMLPDIDSDSGVPVRESIAFGAAVIPMMLVHRFQLWGWSHESIVLAGAAAYLFVRFVLGGMLKRYTVHRGMFHSIPAALIFGELAFLLASGQDVNLRFYKAGGVVLGYMSHLLLDELFSFQFKRGRFRLKSSFGTAMKLVGKNWLANLSAYAKLVLVTVLLVQDPGFVGSLDHLGLVAERKPEAEATQPPAPPAPARPVERVQVQISN